MLRYKMRKASVFLLVFFLLMSLIGEGVTLARVNFKDVPLSHWAYSSIDWGYSKGIVSGFSDGKFLPEKPVSEAEFISMLIRLDCQLNQSSLTTNGKGEHWASANYRYMNQKKMPLLGYTDIKKRNEPIQRGQVAKIIAAFDGFDLSEPYAVYRMYDQDLSNGETGKKDYSDYGVERTLSRAEAVAFLQRLSKRDNCSIQGLASQPAGNDNYQYEPLPMNFLGDRTVSLPRLTPPAGGGGSITVPTGRGYDVDVEHETLIANGRDRTFITVTFNDCQGRPIDYDVEGQFRISSKRGAYINERFRDLRADDSYYSGRSVGYVLSDGPEVTVEVTSIRSDVTVNDTIYFEYTGEKRNSNIDFSCYRKDIEVAISYVPAPELRVEVDKQVLRSDGSTTTEVKATIVRPGGDTIYNYNGQVRFRSGQGAYLSNELVSFSNGVARTTLTSIASDRFIDDEISAEIVKEDTRYQKDIGTVADKVHTVKVYYEPDLYQSTGCQIGDLDVAFVIDSSGSMRRSDPDRKRVQKSQELVHQFTNASRFLGVDFTSSARLFSSPFEDANYIYPRFHSVKQSGGTNISAGLNRAIANFDSNSNRKVIILLTDGKSNKNQVLSALDSAKAKGIAIYTIGLGQSSQIDEDLLKKVASETNGQYFHVLNSAEIGLVYQQLLDSIACGKTSNSCSNAITTFESVKVEKTPSHLEASLFVREACEDDVYYVSLMLRSYSGDVYYDFTHQGYNLYELKKSRQEIVNLDLFNEAIIIAYGKNRNELTRMTVPIK